MRISIQGVRLRRDDGSSCRSKGLAPLLQSNQGMVWFSSARDSLFAGFCGTHNLAATLCRTML